MRKSIAHSRLNFAPQTTLKPIILMRSKKYIQITAGRGPVECARAVTLVARELLGSIPSLQLSDCEPHNQEDGCHMSMTFSTDEPLSPELIRSWQGTVQWVATRNPFRPGHKRKNWFVGVSFFDEIELPEINDSDIVYSACRSGGKGGQNVNKVETSVRATHIPTGITVRCSEERSRAQNTSRARERLLLKLRLLNDSALADGQRQQWSRHDSLLRGNPVRKFSGPLG